MKWMALALLSTLALTRLASPLAAEAQPAGKVYRIGVGHALLRPLSPSPLPVWVAFWQRMRELGWVEGQNFVVVAPSVDTLESPERAPAAMAEVVRAKVDVIVVAVCGTALNAARQATKTVPIVVATCNDDMVATGVIVSLARPGGNVTGLQKLTPELAAKRLSLVKEVFPKVSRVAVLWDPAYSDWSADWKEIRAAARVLGVTLQSVEVRRPDELDSAFSAVSREGAEALITFSDTLTYVHRGRVADLAAKHRLPAMYPFREIPDAGGLMSYGPNLSDMNRRAAEYVDRILKGAKPADLPVEQPTRFELVINLKTAKALGLTIPPAVLARADEVIQ